MKRQWTDEELADNFTPSSKELDLIGDSKNSSSTSLDGDKDHRISFRLKLPRVRAELFEMPDTLSM